MMRTLLLALSVALVGCAAPETPSAADVEPAPAHTTIPASTQGMVLRIPDLSIDAPLVELRRDDAGVLVPPPVNQPEVVGWYAEGVAPGNVGPALIAGHVSGRPDGVDRSVPGIFARLDELTEGSRVTVVRDGEDLAFEVYRLGSFRKDQFPSGSVYGDTDGPELRLVTCGGAFDPTAHSYEENIVVFAKLVT
jgi:sortase (surface protein transpeptidase)